MFDPGIITRIGVLGLDGGLGLGWIKGAYGLDWIWNLDWVCLFI